MACSWALAPATNPRGPAARSAGFTLIELMVTIGLIAVLAALALPTFSESIRSNRVTTAANLAIATLNYARTEAIRSKTTSSVCPRNPGDDKCGSDWKNGLTVWTDDNSSGSWDAGETRRIVEPTKGVDFAQVGDSKAISFDSRGRVVDAAAARTFSLTAQECKSGAATKRLLTVSVLGQATVEKGVCP